MLPRGVFSLFPPVGASQAREFQIFPPVGASQAREFQILSNSLISPYFLKSLKKQLFTMFSWHFPWSSAACQLKHRYKKSFQNNVFRSVYTIFPVKNTVIYTFCRHKSQSKTLVFAVFSMLWHPNTFQNIAICNVFSLLPVFPLPEVYQNDPKFH